MASEFEDKVVLPPDGPALDQAAPPNLDEEATEYEGIFGITAYEIEIPAKKCVFAPWHRPRKQFVRRNQWCKQVIDLLDGGSRSELRYLGLPGEDLLDLRLFHDGVCQPKSLPLVYLGFNREANSNKSEIHISVDEVSKLTNVDAAKSRIHSGDFSDLSNARSHAWKQAVEVGPFDVINLDLCDGLASKAAGEEGPNLYNALKQLLSLQARHKHNWVLFLTTRTGVADVHTTAKDIFLDGYKQNLNNSGFAEESMRLFDISNCEQCDSAIEEAHGFNRVFLVGLCKWLLRLVLGQTPPTLMEVKSVMSYRVVRDSVAEDMFSIAIKFEPQFETQQDPIGLAGAQPDAGADREPRLATKALKRIAAHKNVDQILADDSSIESKMIAETAQLLELARYDVESYHAWVKSDSHTALETVVEQLPPTV